MTAPVRVIWLLLLAVLALVLLVAGCAQNPSGSPTAAPPDESALPAAPVAPAPSEPQADSAAAAPTYSASGLVSAGLIDDFITASYRVIAVVDSPFAPYSLIVATERSRSVCGTPEQPVRCQIDNTCGSTNTSPICYFFIEPSFDEAADPATRFVARWPDIPGITALETGTLRFIDGRTVEFVARAQDEGREIEAVWWLDIVTGAAAELEQTDS